MMKLSAKEFNTLTAQIARTLITSLPADLSVEARKILILTADKPSQFQIDEDGDELLGLYEGISLNEKSILFPQGDDRITIFRLPLLEMCGSMRELKDEIRMTLIHELGHHFGFSESDLEQRGLD